MSHIGGASGRPHRSGWSAAPLSWALIPLDKKRKWRGAVRGGLCRDQRCWYGGLSGKDRAGVGKGGRGWVGWRGGKGNPPSGVVHWQAQVQGFPRRERKDDALHLGYLSRIMGRDRSWTRRMCASARTLNSGCPAFPRRGAPRGKPGATLWGGPMDHIELFSRVGNRDITGFPANEAG